MNQFSTDNSDSSEKTGAFGNDFIAESPALKDLLEIAKNIALVNSPVLIMGEHGSGKSLFAKQIFLYSVQDKHGKNDGSVAKPFVSVNCASFGDGSSLSAIAGEAKRRCCPVSECGVSSSCDSKGVFGSFTKE